MSALLELDGITKVFPGVVANDSVSFDVQPGEVHALLGENGAGKSTLVKMIYGVMRPDGGRMTMNGTRFAPARPGDARAAGIGLVFQHFSLFDALRVGENVALGMAADEARANLDARILSVSNSYGLPLDPRRRVADLSVGDRQRVEVVRCLLQSPRLLIMDEPTSVLTPHEVEALFATLRKLRDEGVAILYISHKLEEIRSLCSRATVLRHGKVVATCDPREETARGLAEMMLGTSLATPSSAALSPGRVRLAVRDMSVPRSTPFGVDLSAISFELRAGELLGIGGVAGNGQDELLDALSGETRTEPQRVLLDDKPIGHLGPHRRRMLGYSSAPEQRLGHAAAPDMSLSDNVFLTGRATQPLARLGFLRKGAASRLARDIVARFDVRTAGVRHAARSLSGGNLQKFLVGRELVQSPQVFVVSQPTWGVDAGAAASIRQALIDLAAGGAAVLVISQDLDELMEMSSRFAVISGGRLSAPQPTSTVTVEAVGALMEGVNARGGQPASAASVEAVS